MIPDWLLGKLRCPATRSPLRREGDRLVAEEGGRSYAILDGGIPDLFVPAGGEMQRKVEEANVRFHDGHAEVYDGMTVRPEEAYAPVTETLERLCREHGGARDLLDAGCGSGVVLKRGKPFFERIVGVDLSEAMLRRCLPIHPDLVRASVFALPLADGSVDAVTGYSLLHHLYDQGAALREFHRVLRPGGFLYTDNDSSKAFHDRFGWWLEIRRAAKAKRARTAADEEVERLAEFHHCSGLDPEAIRGTALEAGFSRVEIVHSHPPVPDEFTRLLMRLEQHEPSPDLRYYFRILAWK